MHPGSTVLVTGARGFVGRNLCLRLRERSEVLLYEHQRNTASEQLAAWAPGADVIFHLAGANRADAGQDFHADNVGLTERILAELRRAKARPHIIFASSIQAELDNAYGSSKREAEHALAAFAKETGSPVTVFRFKNIFGKWGRPNYNSVVATFCHNASRDLPLEVHDPTRQIDLVHVDDVVEALLSAADRTPEPGLTIARDPIPSHLIALGELAEQILAFRQIRDTLMVPDLSQRFARLLLGTYLSYVPAERWEYALSRTEDERGDLAEFIKSGCFGQIFVSRTRPGVTRGNHYHHSKVEKFLVLSSEGLIRFRHVERQEILEFSARGEDYRVVEIPPGFTHSITNVGDVDMITLFWASEPFDSNHPDTTPQRVDLTPAQSAAS